MRDLTAEMTERKIDLIEETEKREIIVVVRGDVEGIIEID